MAIKNRFIFAIVSGALTLSANAIAAADTLPIVALSMQVQPLVAVRSPGSMLSLDVRCEGIDGVGVQTPISISGAPEGTSVEIKPQSGQYALVTLVFPSSVAKGRYSMTVMVGSPASLVDQKVELEIGE